MAKTKENINLVNMGVRLAAIRREKNLSLRQLAANCTIDASNISKIERGQINIKLTTLFELADALEVPPQTLITF